MRTVDTVRAYGVNLRASIVNAHSNYGDAIGLRVLRRLAYEVGANAAEIHGRRIAASILYEAADACVRGEMPVDVEPEVPAAPEPVAEPVAVQPVEVKPHWLTWTWACFLQGVASGGLLFLFLNGGVS